MSFENSPDGPKSTAVGVMPDEKTTRNLANSSPALCLNVMFMLYDTQLFQELLVRIQTDA